MNDSTAWASSSRYTPAATTGRMTEPLTSMRAGACPSARNGALVRVRTARSQGPQSEKSSVPQQTHSTGAASARSSRPAVAARSAALRNHCE
ncbi:hypothetical protein J2S97_000392 [Arthrobacter oryzae]|nr:hypothetical protein [Arthrobacter oryzae]